MSCLVLLITLGIWLYRDITESCGLECKEEERILRLLNPIS